MGGTDPDPGTGTGSGQLVNGNFENGETGWTFSGTSAHGVDTNDAYAGSKYWIWNSSAYTAKASQTVSGLTNGTYTVNAMVKQSTGTATVSKMELSGFGGTTVATAIPHSDSYVKISGTVNVTNGKLDIGFYQEAPGNTNLQIDNVEIVPSGTDNTGGSGGTDPLPTVTITNGGFEAGNLSGWKATGSNVGVDGSDVNSGQNKAYFWGTQSYTQKIEQDVVNVANGSYTVTAMVKQNTGTPTISRMELSGYGGDVVYSNVPHGSTYQKISGTVNVTNGKLNVAFYQAAGGNTNLQIDDVQIVKN
ncbi:carbohydrate binding domain-containing protein [Paenibacillus hexagrammi]|uniref:CBM-cenC domain-containing protein n=1 Tax=Paenibacillus hexagrammi TaxID=2908839 RepID=A0ABY3SEF2_9BACL|nr:carbohydrate binding domain-containing protein [Paenibacillus sp. YPD9-1]UJF31845.1 hypothetical protein L0M14_19020 [Paenibacillus sp. YPD9-1]